MTNSKDLGMQMSFLYEIDKLKGILRASVVLNGERNENDAEHSWHMAIAAMVLKPYFNEEISMEKVLKMILLHDVVEIYAGDNPCFGNHNPNKFTEELASAEKIFSTLPKDQKDEFFSLWMEFEEKKTPEARFANCCDRLQGFIQNVVSDGHTWKKYSVQEHQVLKRVAPIKENIPQVFNDFILPEIFKFKEKGIIKEDNI